MPTSRCHVGVLKLPWPDRRYSGPLDAAYGPDGGVVCTRSRTRMVMKRTKLSAFATMSLSALIALASTAASHQALAQAQQPAAPQASGAGASNAQASLPGPSDELLTELEGVYKDIHANPELSMQERRTAGIAAAWLRRQGYEVTEGVGGTGVVGLLRNGDGPTVMLRADMDALPMGGAPACPMPATRRAPTASVRKPRSRSPAGTTCTWRG